MTYPVGGVKQIHRLAECLSSLGHQATIVQEIAGFHPAWFSSIVKTISLNHWFRILSSLGNSDIAILPETFIERIDHWAKGLNVIIFNQNSAYTFADPKSASLSPNEIRSIYNSNRVLQVLTVSEYDTQSVSGFLNSPSSRITRIVNSIEPSFVPLSQKKPLIAYMPRKNPAHSQVVLDLLQGQSFTADSDWGLVEIDNVPQSTVVSLLQQASIFLSFGHPEGFGLPVAEALACGCMVVGYDGHGGQELYDITSDSNMSIPVPFGDTLRFFSSIISAVNSIETSLSSFYQRSTSASNLILSTYSVDRMRESVLLAVSKAEKLI